MNDTAILLGILVGFVAGASAALLFLGRRLERARKNALRAQSAARAAVLQRRESVRTARDSFHDFAQSVQRDVGMVLRDPRAAGTDPGEHLSRASLAEAMAIASLGEGQSLDEVREAITTHLMALERLAVARGVKGVPDRMAALEQANTIAQRAFEEGRDAYALVTEEIERIARSLGVGSLPESEPELANESEGSLSYSA